MYPETDTQQTFFTVFVASVALLLFHGIFLALGCFLIWSIIVPINYSLGMFIMGAYSASIVRFACSHLNRVPVYK